MTLEQLADRCVGTAGGARRYAAIRGALKGGWISVLSTDRGSTADRLFGEPA